MVIGELGGANKPLFAWKDFDKGSEVHYTPNYACIELAYLDLFGESPNRV
jgi:hypothetical protein